MNYSNANFDYKQKFIITVKHIAYAYYPLHYTYLCFVLLKLDIKKKNIGYQNLVPH